MTTENSGEREKPDWRIAGVFAAAQLIVHVPLSNRYGYFRDELYFFDCGRNLDWGYVDHAPMIGLIYKIMLALGGSLPLIRSVAALASAALVLLAIALTARLGGNRFAQALTGMCILIAPGYLAVASLLTMNIFEPLFWTGCLFVLVHIIQTGESRWWLLFGVLAGLGLENKHSTLFFGAAVVAGLLLTPERREFARPWLWLGGALALLIFLPNLLWQWQHGFPTLETLRNVKATGKNVALDPLSFLFQQIWSLHPATFPVWFTGLVSLLAGKGRKYRALGVVYVVLFAVFIKLGGKDYYLFPAYPVLFAAGAVALSRSLDESSLFAKKTWPKAALLTTLLALGAVLAPLALPLLSPEKYLAYENWLGLARHKSEVAHEGPLPQIFGDQFGWEELVADVARIYNALPAADRARATIFASNYGEAGALHMFGPRYGLPDAICPHQNHFFWGPKGHKGDVVIVLQRSREGLERVFASVEDAGPHTHPWGMAEENETIHVCRGLKEPLDRLWPRLKHWN